MKKDFHKSPLRVFLSYYRPHRKLFFLDMVCALVACFADLAFPYATRYSLNTILPNGLYKTFFLLMGAMVLAYGLKALCNFIITYLGHLMGVRIEADMRTDILTHIQTLSFSFFDKNRTGVLMSRITNDLFSITELSHHGPEILMTSCITILGSFAVLSTICWPLALILLAVVPLYVLFTVRWNDRMDQANAQVKSTLADINATIESGISGVRTAKAFANEKAEGEKFQAANDAYKTAKGGWYKTMGIYHAGILFTKGILEVITIAVGGVFILLGKMNYVDLFTFSLYVSVFTTPIIQLADFIEMFTDGMTGFKRFRDIMNTEPEIQDKPDAKALENVQGDIEYKDVSFAYTDGLPVLEHVSFTLPHGKCMAVVGPSGGGKTTLCQLLPRFYDVTGGAVTLDGQDVRDVTQESLHKNIGIIQQDVFVFADTIRENIRYGRPDATDQEIIAAAMRAEIHDEIMELPDGYDTFVGERGVMLSGGQKQRISIARVFLKNPPVLILDEATSALDSVTEQKIQASLDELAKGRTSIIIAHRLSTVKNAHVIAVVEGSHIREMGTQEELIAQNGAFAKLWRAQNLSMD
jgi:ATP-binding cassette subfamily B protein